jgi:signal transduction histidine kinase
MPYSQPTQPLRRSLATRVVVITVLCALLLSVLLTALLSYASYRYELMTANQQFSNIEKSYLPSLAAGLWEVDTYRINTLLDGIAQLEDVGSIRLTDELQQQFSRTHPDFSKPLATKDYPVFYQVDGEQFPVGQLQVQLMSDHIEQRLWRQSLAIALVTVCALLLSAMLMLAIFRFAVSKHLHAMARFASQLDLNKLEQALHLDRQPRQDELDQVVDAINRLRQRIMLELARRSEIENQLNQQASMLEYQVAQRTTDLQQQNTLLERQSAELAQQNSELDAYAHTVAHDLKHPLTALLGQTALLQGAASALSEQQRSGLLQSIHSSAEKMNNIINALLMLASVRRTDNIATELLDIKTIAASAVNTLSSFASEHNANIRFSEYWPKAMGFSPWLEHVWVNYISNAIKYGGEAPAVVLGANELPNGQIRYWVKDSGPGIALEKQTALFAQFNRLDTKKADGHGLGLSIVARIVQRLGGETGYEAPPDGGSLFWFSLPAE